jgi:hypothetical protein
MYPIKRTFKWVRNRLVSNQSNLLPSESFVLTMFLVEKIIRRVFLQLIISAGYPTENAKEIVNNIRGLDALKNSWKLYDPQFRSLTDILPAATWQIIQESATLRNKLIHGAEHQSQKVYRQKGEELFDALGGIRTAFDNAYSYSGWKGLKLRTSTTLHTDPKVQPR